MMIFKKWFIVFALCLVTFVVSADNQEEVESPSSQAASFQAIVEKAERGDVDAQFNLGLMYFYGKGVTQNDIEAAKWFRQAAEQGHARASGILGRILIAQGKFDEAQSVTEKAHQKQPQELAWIINLGHIFLLKGDRQTARSYYQEALPLILDNASFEQGLVADFEWFIEKGWQIKACRSELEWILLAFEQLKLANTYDMQVIRYYQQGLFQIALPFAEKAWNLRKKILGEKHPETITRLNNLALIHRELGHLTEALPLSEKGYRLSKELLGEKHPDTLSSLNNLALIHRDLGNLNEALPLSEKCYHLSKEVLGEKHPNTVLSLNNLVAIYQVLGRLTKALPLSKKVYRLFKEELGEKHPDTLMSLNNLVAIYQVLGRLTEALPLSEKAYRLSKEVLGEKYPDTLISLNNLALIYKYLGHLNEALPLFKKGYRLSKEVLGEKHPNTLMSLNNLALIHIELGSLTEALPLFKKGYRLSKEVLGEKHPDTLSILNNLAIIHKELGHLTEALPLFEKAYRLSKEVLGEKHTDTLISLNNLAMFHKELGNLNESLLLTEKSYSLNQEVLGKKHPTTLLNLNNLAMIYQDLGRLNESSLLTEKSYSLSQEVLGKKHPTTLLTLNNLAMIHKELGNLNESLLLTKKSYSLNQEVLGKKHPTTLLTLNNLAMIHKELGNLNEALLSSEKAYRLFSDVLGEKHPNTVRSLNNLALIHKDLGDLNEALPLFEKGYRLHKEVLGEKHSHTLLSLSNLAYTYFEQGNINKAIEHLETFMAGVENLRRGDLSAENRQALFKQWVPDYFLLSHLYTAQSRQRDAFRLAEMSKARTLLESLAAKLAAQQSGLTTAEQRQLQKYDASLAQSTNRIAKALEDNRLYDRIRLETEKNQLVNQLAQFERELRAKYSKYDQLSEVQIIGAKEGAKYLPADAVLISYLVNENEVLAFTLQADGTLTTHDLGKIPCLEKDLETYNRQLSSGWKEQEESAQSQNENKPISLKKCRAPQFPSLKLGKQLLEPLKDIIKDKPHWIISPSGALALIPFETLRLEGENQPVIAQHQISYVQSLSVLKLLQERDKFYKSLENRETLLAMGAPIYENADAATNEDHPRSVDFKIADLLVMRGGDYARAFRQLNLKWQKLDGAERELEQLKELFKETKPRIYIKADATEAKLKSLNEQGILAQSRYLVFSAHGYLSPQVPALSSIVLGQVNNPQGIDGYVTAGEWPGYDLKSDLMVLSACETGLGEVVGGEGVMGLPYAFYVAGNKNTILTLWKISDDITTGFITSFFAKLKAGVGQIEALTATKREFLKKGGIYSNPKYWAAFVLYGV
jgi:CHAT domain-containing protein/uncharacterized protein YqgQ